MFRSPGLIASPGSPNYRLGAAALSADTLARDLSRRPLDLPMPWRDHRIVVDPGPRSSPIGGHPLVPHQVELTPELWRAVGALADHHAVTTEAMIERLTWRALAGSLSGQERDVVTESRQAADPEPRDPGWPPVAAPIPGQRTRAHR